MKTLFILLGKLHSHCFPKVSFKQAAFSVCGRQVQCKELENFLSLRKGNYVPQQHAENAAGLNSLKRLLYGDIPGFDRISLLTYQWSFY